MTNRIEFQWDAGMVRMVKAVDPAKFKKALDQRMPTATLLNAHIVQREIRESIKNGLYHPNAALTIAIKRSSKPLVDTGHGLFQAVSVDKQDNQHVFVGVLRTDAFYNIAVAVHDGVSIKVSDKMRGLFYVLWRASSGKIPTSELTGRAAELFKRMPGGWLPLKKETQAIIIPARPFTVKAFSDPKVHATVQRNWNLALAATFKDLANQP